MVKREIISFVGDVTANSSVKDSVAEIPTPMKSPLATTLGPVAGQLPLDKDVRAI